MPSVPDPSERPCPWSQAAPNDAIFAAFDHAGNVAVPETPLDSIARVAAAHGVHMGIAAPSKLPS